MYGKILITVLVLWLGWLAIRTRLRGGARPSAPARPPLIPAGLLPALAYTAMAVMIAGTGLYLFERWEAGREAVRVRVINANTGAAVTYEARREDVVGRSFRTLDGRRITLADVERMELDEEPAQPAD